MDIIDKLYQGDCIEVMRQMPDACIDLVVTDPPYLISYKTNHRKNKDHEFTSEIKNDSNPELITNYIKECYRIMKDNTAMYMFCSADKVDFFKQELEKYFKIKNMIIWLKNNWSAGDLQAAFGRQYEICFLVNKGRKKFNGKRITDVWQFDRVVGTSQVHQNQKPLELIKQCIEKHSQPGELIFDGFGGSGTTALASKELGRHYMTVEFEEKYCKLICERLGVNEICSIQSISNEGRDYTHSSDQVQSVELDSKEIEKVWEGKVEENPHYVKCTEPPIDIIPCTGIQWVDTEPLIKDNVCSVCGATYDTSYEEHEKRPFHQGYL